VSRDVPYVFGRRAIARAALSLHWSLFGEFG
jgi:hypothetical protein